ncbi:hypothetical protein VTO42DRAFT_8512 [Malbranchea cinnamomea]
MTKDSPIPSRLNCLDKPPSLEILDELCSRTTDPGTYPLARSVEKNIPIYDISTFSLSDESLIHRLQDEWHHVLSSGPGVFVTKGLYTDKDVLERTNAAYERILAREKSLASDDDRNTTRGDHFAANGENERIWNSLTKHALEDPTSFIAYFSNPWVALACEAWLGPGYRVTTQVNIVKPGGEAQRCHRDYHLGFQTAEHCAMFPRTMQVASQFLTLQGAVAHSDMPLASGPTRVLPFSQLFEDGFLAYRRKEFQQYFADKFVALPLEMGDGLFFNPALFHAAGANELPVTDGFERKANLIQASSALGKTMENVDSVPIVEACWDGIVDLLKRHGKVSREVRALVSAIGEGYPFPTNLDNRPPAPNGMAPESEQDVILRALEEGWSCEEVMTELRLIRKLSCA